MYLGRYILFAMTLFQQGHAYHFKKLTDKSCRGFPESSGFIWAAWLFFMYYFLILVLRTKYFHCERKQSAAIRVAEYGTPSFLCAATSSNQLVAY
jgi:hypothetical protein